MPEKTLEQAALDRHAAALALHWHLCRAANMVITGLLPGRDFESEILRVEMARKAWYDAQDAIVRAKPPDGH